MKEKKVDLSKLKPDEVIAWINGEIREGLGDRVENKARIYASHGYYYIKLKKGEHYCLRRRQVPESVRALVALARGV